MSATGTLKKVTILVEDLDTGAKTTIEVPRCHAVGFDVDYEPDFPVVYVRGLAPSRRIERIRLEIENPLPDQESGHVYRLETH